MSEPPVTVRPARADDSETVRGWRNDPITRAMSRTNQSVGRDAHETFWRRVVDDPELVFLIGETQAEPFGVVAFERIDGEWEASTHIAPARRGHGLAVPLVREGIAAAFPEGAPQLRAEIKADNPISRHVFEANGFRQVDRRDDLLIYERKV